MRSIRTSPLLVSTLAVAGCASSPPLVAVRVPAPDPYRVPREDAFARVASIHAPRPKGWDDARQAAQIAALSTVVRVTLDRGTSRVTGPEAAAEVVAGFLVDRARFEHERVRLEAYHVDVAPDALSFEALTPCPGGAFAHVPVHVAADLVPAPRRPVMTLLLLDGESSELDTVDQRAHIAGCVQGVGATGVLKNPIVDIITCGRHVSTTSWLAGAGDVLVLTWRQEGTRATLARDAQVLVRDEAGFTAIPVSLPRVHGVMLDARVVLRRGEALVLVQALPDQDDLRLTIVTWDRAPIP